MIAFKKNPKWQFLQKVYDGQPSQNDKVFIFPS